MPPRPKLDDADITGTYLKGTGPGGQKIVRMKFLFVVLTNYSFVFLGIYLSFDVEL